MKPRPLQPAKALHRQRIIPPSLKKHIQTHCVAFRARMADDDQLSAPIAPPFLIIISPPGTGKTTATELSCQEIGVETFKLSAATMTGELEGQALKPLIEAYLRAGNTKSEVGAAVIINDFDRSIARVSAVATETPNSGTLRGLLNSIGDNPRELEIAEHGKLLRREKVLRPPVIIVTANDRSVFDDAMTRDGRAHVIEYTPSHDDRALMVTGIYPQLTEDEAFELVSAFPDREIAFLDHIGIAAVRQKLPEMVDFTAKTLARANFAVLAREMRAFILNLNLNDLIAAGRALEASSHQQKLKTMEDVR